MRYLLFVPLAGLLVIYLLLLFLLMPVAFVWALAEYIGKSVAAIIDRIDTEIERLG